MLLHDDHQRDGMGADCARCCCGKDVWRKQSNQFVNVDHHVVFWYIAANLSQKDMTMGSTPLVMIADQKACQLPQRALDAVATTLPQCS